MNRKIIIVSGIITFLIICYMGYDLLVYHSSEKTCSFFFNTYLNNTQKYIFNGMIYGMPIIASTTVKFYIPEIFIRIKGNMIWSIVRRSIKVALLIAAYVISVHGIVLFFCGIKPCVNIEILNIWIRLSLFYLQCTVIFYLIYILTGQYIVSILLHIINNLGVLLIFIAIIYELNDLNDIHSLIIFIIYEIVSLASSGLALFIIVKNKKNYIQAERKYN